MYLFILKEENKSIEIKLDYWIVVGGSGFEADDVEVTTWLDFIAVGLVTCAEKGLLIFTLF
jgi:hypothetical protein